MIRKLSRASARLANLVLPHQCVICRCFAESTGLCAACWRELALIAAPVCRRCGLPLGLTLSDPICAACFTDPPPLAAIRAALHYNDSSRQLILAFKHGDALQLTPFLSALVARDFAALCTTDTLVVPVPLHSRRYLKRRYNQSAELARHLCRITGVGQFAPDVLARRRATISQGGLSRHQRRRNLAGAFAVPPAKRADLAGRRVLLVDDVMTTGATLFEAAKSLAGSGSGEVSALVLARVVRPREA